MFEVGKVQDLYRSYDRLPDFVAAELNYWYSEGVLCIYASVLAYNLYRHFDIFTTNNMKFVQGYYFHNVNIDNPIVKLMGDEHIGLHAWLVVNGGAVLDFTINQEEMFFDFKQPCGNVFLGPVSKGMYLKGGIESAKIVSKWTAAICKQSGVSEEEWIQKHISLFNEILSK